ncbi:MAG: isoprenylcysteine carboxylmethyltransferase family protein [Pirellulaceae bacterium]|nr:isoprenylcysteine carboxylmethyltransferase family protein [Pirellulaceae bacterium]
MRRYWFPKRYADTVAKLRVPAGFLMVAAFAWLAMPTRISLMWGAPLSVAGLLVRAWAAGHLAKNTTLAAAGPYRYLRNPLYLGTVMVAAGLAVSAREPILGLLFAAMFILVYLPVIEREEQHLRTLFPDYAHYAERVPMLLPKLSGHRQGGRFSQRLYMKNQEYNALFGYLAGLAFLVWKARSG